MTRCVYILLIFVLTFSCDFVYTLQCYTCMEKLRGNCYYGYTENMKTLNCSESTVCVTYQSETTQGSHSYVSTTRGCENQDICNIINENKPSTSKSVSVLCETCNTTLCNRAFIKSSYLIIIVLCISLASI
ncbi:uncharacterized protein LOC130901499 [Diorhabda carinulata]|uniref:uncharacterized protein LOC130901499 n=1 Tax=Diorhabda carinulata TaxID=1163345 RepID=UPI0025A20FDC|nr:uncharacterized protein LOC130901499 [Diorhabda carinulata]